ncbi:hypothetical protein ACHAW5_001960 [Stephanodiscus triporus]|uniref:Uncharacterized protein n=1 Tax=Stephanodiscus triporus TaxID=2934178 RepID=A0ABD3MZF6_9STRA
MLVELARIVRGVDNLLQAAAAAAAVDSGPTAFVGGGDGAYAPSFTGAVVSGRQSGSSHLPWRAGHSPHTPSRYSPVMAPLDEDARDGGPAPPSPYRSAATETTSPPTESSCYPPTFDGARLRQLAPLLDRLGRTLTDAAPHIAALADSLPPSMMQPQPHLGSVASNRTSIVAAGDAYATTAPVPSSSGEDVDPIQSLTARASHLYFGIGNDENEEESDDPTGYRLTETTYAVPASRTSMAPLADNLEVIHEETTPRIDPDLTDYVNGMVNTTRGGGGGFGSGRSSNRDNGMDSLSSSLLATYLASIGGNSGAEGGNGGNTNGRDNARVIRMGGGIAGNGGSSSLGGEGAGIDIHIHAIVTGPGMEGIGGLGDFVMDYDGGIGGDATTITAPRNNDIPFFDRVSPPGNNYHDDDDADLFSELYSESPDPVNLHADEDMRINGIGYDDFERLFEECQSIEDYDSDCNDSKNEDEAVDRTTKLNSGDSVFREDFNTQNGNNDNIDGSIESLSEIESQESMETLPPPSSPSSLAAIRASMRIGSIGRNSAPAIGSSPSLGSRFFRRTFGRLSGSASRRSS